MDTVYKCSYTGADRQELATCMNRAGYKMTFRRPDMDGFLSPDVKSGTDEDNVAIVQYEPDQKRAGILFMGLINAIYLFGDKLVD